MQLLTSRFQRRDNVLRGRDVRLGFPLRESCDEHNKYLLSCNSRRQMRWAFESQILENYHNAERILRFRILKSVFHRWMCFYPCRRRIAKRYSCPEYLDFHIPYKTIMINGFRILFIYLWHVQRWRLREALLRWKENSSGIRDILSKFLRKWTSKVTLWQLNRLHGTRYLKKMSPFARKIIHMKKQSAFAVWKSKISLQRKLLQVRLIFRCWKLFAASKRVKRLMMLREGLTALRSHHQFSIEYRVTLLSKLHRALSFRLTKKTFSRWRWLRRRIVCLRRLLLTSERRGNLFFAFSKWKSFGSSPIVIERALATPVKSMEPAIPATPSTVLSSVKKKKAVYQDSAGTTVYKEIHEIRRGRRKCASPYCSHADLYCGSDGSVPCRFATHTLHVSSSASKNMTPQQKAKLRMHVLQSMNKEYASKEASRLSVSKEGFLFEDEYEREIGRSPAHSKR